MCTAMFSRPGLRSLNSSGRLPRLDLIDYEVAAFHPTEVNNFEFYVEPVACWTCPRATTPSGIRSLRP